MQVAPTNEVTRKFQYTLALIETEGAFFARIAKYAKSGFDWRKQLRRC